MCRIINKTNLEQKEKGANRTPENCIQLLVSCLTYLIGLIRAPKGATSLYNIFLTSRICNSQSESNNIQADTSKTQTYQQMHQFLTLPWNTLEKKILLTYSTAPSQCKSRWLIKYTKSTVQSLGRYCAVGLCITCQLTTSLSPNYKYLQAFEHVTCVQTSCVR